MNQRPQANAGPAPARAISTPAEARQLAEAPQWLSVRFEQEWALLGIEGIVEA